MTKESLIKLLLCFVLVITTVAMAAATEPELVNSIAADEESASSAETSGTATLVTNDEVTSAKIKEADGTTGQNTNSGSGIKTNHIQNNAVTAPKIKANAVTMGKIANGAVTDAKIAAGAVTDLKITGPITASKIGFTGLNADLLDGLHASSFALTTHNHDATYVNVTGDTMTGTLTAAAFVGNGAGLTNVNHNVTACPSAWGQGSYTKIEFNASTLCIARDNWSETWNEGQIACDTLGHGASLCTHQQVRRACNHGNFALTLDTWMADRTADDHALYVNNGSNCDNFDGESEVLTTSRGGAYCCLEWMKY